MMSKIATSKYLQEGNRKLEPYANLHKEFRCIHIIKHEAASAGAIPNRRCWTTRARFLGREDERVSPVTPAVPQAYSAHPTVVITAALPLPE